MKSIYNKYRSTIRDENVDGDAVDPDLVHRLDGPVEHVRRVGVEPEDDSPVHQDTAIVETRDVVLEVIGGKGKCCLGYFSLRYVLNSGLFPQAITLKLKLSTPAGAEKT